MIVKLEICDNGGWHEPIAAETVEGECIDCGTTGLVLRYLAPHLCDEVEICPKCFAADDDLRVVPTGLVAEVLRSDCSGPNPACRAAAVKGRKVHVTTGQRSAFQEALVMPTYHFKTSAEGIESIYDAWETAPLVQTDEDLDRYRAENRAHRLPVGWVDPSRRR